MKYAALAMLVLAMAGGVIGWSKFSQPMVLGYDFAQDEIASKKDKTPDTRKFLDEIKEMFGSAKGKYSLYVYRPDEQTGYGINENTVMVAASMMKVPILMAAENAIAKGTMQIDQIYTLKESDKRSGSGPLEYYDAGTRLSVATLMKEMGKKSDNTAPVILVNLLGNEAVETAIKNLGMKDSSFKDNKSTALDMARMWATIYEGEGLSQEQKDRIWENLSGSIYEDRIPAGLPSGTKVIHKVGTGDGVWGDAGIVMAPKPFVLVIMNKDVDFDEAGEIVAKATKMVWEYEIGR